MKILGVRRTGRGGRPQSTGRLGLLRSLWKDLRLTAGLTRDLLNGSYTRFPYRAAGAFLLALAYIVFPADLLADVVPVVGWLDDGVVTLLCLKMAEYDLKRYETWKKQREGAEDED